MYNEQVCPLGKGSFGTVMKGRWRGTDVVVKAISVRNRDEAALFCREADVLCSLRHPNIVPFIGVCMRVPDRCWMVFEYMHAGTLTR
jgi:serine/threonine protein kinase